MPRKRRCGYKNLLICLYGKGDTGKTSTLLELGEILRQKSSTYTEIKGKSSSVDKRMVFDALGNKIGIGTYGDNLDLIDKNIKELVPYKRRVIVTASRDRIDRAINYSTYKNLSAFLKSAAVWNARKVWVEKLNNCNNKRPVVHVTGVGELLYYIKRAVSSSCYIDEDII